MNNKVVLAVAALILLLITVGIVVMRHNKSNEASTSPGPSNTAKSSVTISYVKGGFNPASVTVKSGGTVTIKNDSSEQLEFNSNPHPVHTDNPELNVGSIAPGQSKTITVVKVGTWGYHNHLDPSDQGTIIVQ
jgi:plastocyanin